MAYSNSVLNIRNIQSVPLYCGKYMKELRYQIDMYSIYLLYYINDNEVKNFTKR